MVQTRVLQLKRHENYNGMLFRVKKGWRIRFTLEANLQQERTITLHCNHTPSNTYQILQWLNPNVNKNDPIGCHWEVEITHAGVFHFYLENSTEKLCTGSFLVDPDLSLPSGQLHLDSIIIETVLTKCLGPFSHWRQRLEVSYQAGFNMIHFTPIQELGESNSSYSIKNHMKFDPRFTTDTTVTDLTEEILTNFISDIREDWHMLSIVDIVLNHTANNSDWIVKHPECSFNIVNSPHLRPAFVVDRALWYLNKEIMMGKYSTQNLSSRITPHESVESLKSILRPAFVVDRALWYLNKEIMMGKYSTQNLSSRITSHESVESLRSILRTLLKSLHLHEFFVVDVEKSCQSFLKYLQSQDTSKQFETSCEEIAILQDKEYKRYGSTVDFEKAFKYCAKQCNHVSSNEERTDAIMKAFQENLRRLNREKMSDLEEIFKKIIYNTIGHVTYHFVDETGPKYQQVTEEHSISVRYFAYPFTATSLKDDIALMENTDKALLIMAHNGWVMGGDALKNFAASDSNVYLNRELIAWGDSIKLNYGDQPEDCPYLWKMMTDYVEQMARIFHGFRLDNCHSTPIHVAEYLIARARKINPNLYVIAELFTNSEETDNMFINKLGLNSLIRENLGAHSPRDLGRHVHRYGGYSVGSFIQPSVLPLTSTMSHAVFMDVTHDNPSLFEVSEPRWDMLPRLMKVPVSPPSHGPQEKGTFQDVDVKFQSRSVFDILPSVALVLATCSGAGSNRGLAELVPHHIHVVNESRLYQSWSAASSDLTTEGYVTKHSCIIPAKKALNRLHKDLKDNGFTEVFVDQASEEITFVTRHSPVTHESVIFVTHAAFQKPDVENYPYEGETYLREDLPVLKIEGVLTEVLFEGQLLEPKDKPGFLKHDKYINGSTAYKLSMQENIPITQSKLSEISSSNGDNLEIRFKNFYPGSVIIFKVTLTVQAQKAVSVVRNVLSQFPQYNNNNFAAPTTMSTLDTQPFKITLEEILTHCTLTDFNRILFRCNNEELDDQLGSGVYNIPGHGDLVYAGLQGFMSILQYVRTNNDLGHSICKNLRDGNWMLEYIGNRLKLHKGTKPLGLWFETIFSYLSQLPRYLIPSYFDAIISSVYERCLYHVFKKMSSFIRNGSALVQSLSLGSVEMLGESKSSSLPPIMQKFIDNDNFITMAAGLPHFSTGYMRCWGRDTFISLKGLLLIPGRYDIARNLILAFAGVLRHGLIPNLLSGGVNARYNSRDATWFWCQAVQEYTKSVGNHGILDAPVLRMYPDDDSEAVTKNAQEVPLQDILHEILQRHFEGVTFRERNAGVSLDQDMSSEGFNQRIGVDYETGFVYGGNKDNCGTWMDKMGSSTIAKNKGHPATPRDGSAVEIVGLCKSLLRWLIDLQKTGIYKHHHVTCLHEGKQFSWSYEDWNDKIQENFHDKFYVTESSSDPYANKRCIYKDSYLSSNKFTDYQLRPNFPIAMCVAPELFGHEEAKKALKMVEKYLLGPIGLATLDSEDWAYDGNYENSIDNDVFNKARGFNYHQGPEWTWVLGPFLRAKLLFTNNDEKCETIQWIYEILSKHYDILCQSDWKGLPELTNKNGTPCYDSCPTQSWSMACLLEVLYDIDGVSSAL